MPQVKPEILDKSLDLEEDNFKQKNEERPKNNDDDQFEL